MSLFSWHARFLPFHFCWFSAPRDANRPSTNNTHSHLRYFDAKKTPDGGKSRKFMLWERALGQKIAFFAGLAGLRLFGQALFADEVFRPGTTSTCSAGSAAGIYEASRPRSRRTMLQPCAMALAL